MFPLCTSGQQLVQPRLVRTGTLSELIEAHFELVALCEDAGRLRVGRDRQQLELETESSIRQISERPLLRMSLGSQ